MPDLCRICRLRPVDSFEHVPPKSSFNDKKVIRYSGKGLFVRGAAISRRIEQKGAGERTLCEGCNNHTGSWYVPSFTCFAEQAHRVLSAPTFDKSTLNVPFEIRPQRVHKQLVAMFLSACGEEFSDAHTQLSRTRYVLNRDILRIDPMFRVYCYYYDVHNSTATRQSGLSGMLEQSKLFVFSEIAFYPLGFVMTVNSPSPDPDLASINFFQGYALEEQAMVHLEIPVKTVRTPYPADFR